jgi:hypothetical protein
VFKGRHFDRSVILLWVRWYLAYNLSLRNLEEDGRAWHLRRSRDRASLGCPVLARTAEALQLPKARGHQEVARGRNVYQGARTLDGSVNLA